MKKILLLISWFIFQQSDSSLFAQNTKQDLIQIKSVDTYAFEKYGNVPINMYSGALDLSLPIVTFPVKDFSNINVALNYDSSGFIPRKKNNIAGYNWNLIAGGRITRKVNLLPDEYIGNPTAIGSNPFGIDPDLHGFLHGVRKNPYTNEQVYDLNSGAGSHQGYFYWLGTTQDKYEGEPDVYRFNILHLSGEFMIGNDGNVRVQSNDPSLKVDISKIKAYRHDEGNCIPETAIIRLIDGQGNMYEFGGDMSTYEIAYQYNHKIGGNKQGYSGYPYINSYSIKKIILKNKDIISFDYLPLSQHNNQEYFCQLMSWSHENYIRNNWRLFDIESYKSTGSNSENISCPRGFGHCYNSNSSNSSSDSYVLMKKSILSKIHYNNFTINFNYKDAGYAIRHHALNTDLMTNEMLIDQIELLYNNDQLDKVNFGYTHLGGTHQRSFLTRLQTKNVDKFYSFEYSQTNQLPAYYTLGIDHWGFWNGQDHNRILHPLDTYDALSGDYTLENTIRDPNPSKYNVGLLSKIKYPTKGFTVFEYESPAYGKRLERNSASMFLPTLTNKSGIIGGARILKKTDFNRNNQIEKEISYQYTESIDSNISSGILMNWPRYLFYFEFYNMPMNASLLIINSSNVQENSLDSYNIGYSKVFEIEKGKGYIEHNFNSYINQPDILHPVTSNIKQYVPVNYTVVPYNLYKNVKNIYGIDKSILRGKPSSRLFFNQNRHLIQKEEYVYNDIINFNHNTLIDDQNFVSIQHLSGIWVQGYKKYFNTNDVIKRTVSDYYMNTPLIVSTDYNYESPYHLQNSSETSTNSKEEKTRTNYFYPLDLLHEPYMYQLLEQNRLHDPVITKVFNNENGISEQKTVFGQFGELILPKHTYSRKGHGINSLTDKKITYDSYDSKGNITQYTLLDGTPVSIIWGYDDQYPVVKAEGVKLNDLKNVSNYSSQIINAIVYQTTYYPNEISFIMDLFNQLRIHETCKDGLVTTYTYKPLVGLATMTGPDNQTFYYEYDDFGRLRLVKNDKDEVLNSYDYHYAIP